MCGTLASVSTLLTSVGCAPSSENAIRVGVAHVPADLREGEQSVEIWRQQAWERLVALDHLEQRLLLAEQILLRTGDDLNGPIDPVRLGHLCERARRAS